MYDDIAVLPARMVETFRGTPKHPEDACLIWDGAVDRYGYGIVYASVDRRQHRTGAHRISYLLTHGTIGAELQIDHLCRVRRCVNPDHLEAVTSAENTRRGIWTTRRHCKHGHEFTPENTARKASDGSRVCRECQRIASRRNGRKWRQRQRAVAQQQARR